ncbi:3-hydroxyacyl-CoA dehydrogenase family protein [Hornefia butyriciproducens]|uniref:3-hydroxyacyl-CoA dehydrogenase family protein n=1 Tax=Hornefia butyriciproducens TaxID=2652293 RepID=UPI0023F274B1|nr:3-hydroxyacyl-CoA dehydrogenase family protein [Hornefia butyriciproducens]MDD6299168.1 3-hydroxyacyl-CoA dehydrogenase family protein [Hornefia butyriciproducens]
MIKKIGVVGAGMMGAEIALCFARTGYETMLNDISLEFAERGKQKIAGVMDKNIKKGRATEDDKQAALDRVHPTGSLEELADCDLIIEAVLEVWDVKKDVHQTLDKLCKGSTIIASNTSSMSISKLASCVGPDRKGQFIGTHFNSPASVMKLVEVIPGLLTKDETAEEVTKLLEEIGKVPVRVKDVVGFGLNRIFHCMYGEACRLVEEGVCSVEDVDKICKYGLGHPMGIFALLDITGHDLNLEVDEILFEAYGDRFRPSPQLHRLVDSGRLGRKTGAGFYDYGEK